MCMPAGLHCTPVVAKHKHTQAHTHSIMRKPTRKHSRQPVLLGGQHVRAAAAAAVGRVEQVRVIIARCEVGVADDRGPMPEEAVAGGVAAAATG
eukprot:scaffold22541_cov18-Tisochrysis_lutea.AAC.1